MRQGVWSKNIPADGGDHYGRDAAGNRFMVRVEGSDLLWLHGNYYPIRDYLENGGEFGPPIPPPEALGCLDSKTDVREIAKDCVREIERYQESRFYSPVARSEPDQTERIVTSYMARAIDRAYDVGAHRALSRVLSGLHFVFSIRGGDPATFRDELWVLFHQARAWACRAADAASSRRPASGIAHRSEVTA